MDFIFLKLKELLAQKLWEGFIEQNYEYLNVCFLTPFFAYVPLLYG
jgi:hypothetical protein